MMSDSTFSSLGRFWWWPSKLFCYPVFSIFTYLVRRVEEVLPVVVREQVVLSHSKVERRHLINWVHFNLLVILIEYDISCAIGSCIYVYLPMAMP